MPRWGKGRFKLWKEEALSLCRENPDGIPMALILDSSRLGSHNIPQSVRHGTEILKRDSRFASHYPEAGQYGSMIYHRKVLSWTVNDNEE